MAAAREHLKSGRPADAVAVLEGEILNAGRSEPFFALLRTAYSAQVQDLEGRNAAPAAIEAVRRRQKALENVASNSHGKSGLGPNPDAEAAASVRAPAPPIPDAPAELVPPSPPRPDGPTIGDPFLQVPRDAAAPSAELVRASEAFAAKRYAQAEALFAGADRRKERFSEAQKDEWAYCRLHAVAVQLGSGAVTETAGLTREVEAALAIGSERLRPFGRQLLNDLRRRDPPGPDEVPAGWRTIQTASFRVLHRGDATQATEVGRIAEAARRAMYQRWAGPPAGDWSPRCDVYLHATGAEYAKATGKSAENCGHATVGTRAGQPVSRRIDLRADEPGLLDIVLPHETTQVVLAELFADQPLPRWALVGMAALAESPEGVARYQRAVPGLLKEKKLFAVGPFLERGEFPDPDAVTAFYAESVSLVAYLVELKGPKAFTAFVREAPRRGYARALATHYGFKDPAELQDRWVKHAMGAE
jgi:hypothetical protein